MSGTTEVLEPEVEQDLNADKVALYNPIEAGISGLVEKYKGGPKDLAIPAHYEECRLALSETRGIRSKTEKLRKELKADALAYGRLVDSTAKRIIDQVLEIEEPFATAKKDFDTRIEIEKREKALAEERRVDGIAKRIADIGNLVAAHVSSSSGVIESLLPGLAMELAACSEWAMEFSEKAETVTNDTLSKLAELHAMKVQHEQAAAEKIRMEKESAEKAEADRVQREKEAAEERVRLAKEREALEAERAAMQAERDKLAKEQAEKDRIAAEEQAVKDRAAKEEQDRLAAVQREKDLEAEAERAKMAAEIEALKDRQEKLVEELVGPPSTQPVTTASAPTITTTLFPELSVAAKPRHGASWERSNDVKGVPERSVIINPAFTSHGDTWSLWSWETSTPSISSIDRPNVANLFAVAGLVNPQSTKNRRPSMSIKVALPLLPDPKTTILSTIDSQFCGVFAFLLHSPKNV